MSLISSELLSPLHLLPQFINHCKHFPKTMKAKFSFRPLFRSKSKKARSVSGSNASSLSLSSSSLSSFEGKETPKSVLPDLDVFKLFDRDGDGKISLQELELVFHRLGVDPPTEEELLLLLQEADRDGDGCISAEEFGALSAAMGPAQVEELREAFDYYDRDGDGRISAAELQRVFAAIGEERCTLEDCRRMIGGVDAEEKGFVCFEDFARMMMVGR